MLDFLVTMDIGKAFDSLHHIFLISVFGEMQTWSKLYLVDRNTILKNQKSCVCNGE